MPTGAFWNVTNPAKPWGVFDPSAQLPIPFDWAEWLAAEGAAYVSHEIIPDPVLEEVSSEHAAGVVTAVIKLAAPPAYTVSTKYPVKCRITASANGNTLIDERTVYLKITER
jgi:hypothetical protein